MKKTFLAKRNALLSSSQVSWGFVALICALVIVLLRVAFPNIFFHLASPLVRGAGVFTSSAKTITQSFKDAAALAKRNEQLVYENQALAYENQTLSEKIRDLDAFTNAALPEGVFTGVLMRPPESPYDTLVLSSGSEKGIAAGMGVFGIGGVPLGVVTEVTKDFSRATFFSSPKMTTHGWIGAARTPIELQGMGGGSVRALVPRRVEVAVGDAVFLPGPGAVPFGTIVRVDDNPASPEVELRIAPSVNMFSLTWVQVKDVGSALRGFVNATSTL